MTEPIAAEIPGISAREVFDRQRAACLKQPLLSYGERIHLLKTIESILLENDEAICDAICTDFGNRSIQETQILEITPSLMGLRHTAKHLKKWMSVQKRHVSMVFWGGKNRVIPQSKGVVGIVSPWNYPLFLAISPMTAAIAAGNRIMVKQAANSQNLCRLLARKFSEKISMEKIAILPGTPGGEFSGLPYDHLIFTGSPQVGKTIMEGASKHLTPVTLELGGKSPTILAPDFDIKTAVERIMYGKLINSGQTCIAPDYLFVPEEKVDDFVAMAKKVVAKRYPDMKTRDYTNIIDRRAYARLVDTLEDARAKNAQIINLLPGPQTDEPLKKISPTILTSMTQDMRIMKEEIFGPLLPVMGYRSMDQVIEYINDRPRPLALYLYTNDAKVEQQVLDNTRSGGVTINDCAMHVAQHDLPFGGVGNSGMGQYHGYEGFLEFSKLRPVFKQARFTLALTPPYGAGIQRIYKAVKKLKWLS